MDQELDLGELRLEPGGSIVGRVEVPARAASTSAVTVLLEPDVAPATPELLRELDRSPRLRPDPRGFFQFRSLKPGSYRLVVDGGRSGEATFGPLSLVPGEELELARALELQPNALLPVRIVPPVGPDGQRWRLELRPADPRHGSKSVVASDAGLAKVADLKPGEYVVKVFGPEPAPVAGAFVDLPHPEELLLEIDAIRVSGRVLLGREPIEAQLFFVGRTGLASVRARSGPDGDYEVVLPRPGPWRIEIESEALGGPRNLERQVDRPEGEGPVRLDLELPDNRLVVRVVDEQQAPVADAGVLATRKELPVSDVGRTGRAGRVELKGLEPDRYFLQAVANRPGAPALRSELREVEMARDSRLEVELQLFTLRALRGQVVGLYREPLPGVGISVIPMRSGQALSLVDHRALTRPDGSFELEIPSQASELLVTLEPGGPYGLTVVRVPLSEEPWEIELLPRLLGGTLRIPFIEPVARSGRSGAPMLFQEEVLVPWKPLLAWSERVGGIRVAGESLELPQLGKGRYRLCRVEEAAIAQVSLAPGLLRPGAGCQEAVLSGGATVEFLEGP